MSTAIEKEVVKMIPTEETLMIPGPTPVPSNVLREMARPMINHRGSAFNHLYNEIQPLLKRLFQTEQDVLILTGSGTAGMEAAIVNTLSSGDIVISCPVGVFGERFREIARRYGANVEILETPMGEPLEPQRLSERLKQDAAKNIKAVLITHNETSTGVENDLEQISKVCKDTDHPALLLVDAVSSVGAVELSMDKWGVDVVVTASQKALMTPPGLAFVAMSERAWEASKTAKMPRFYLDLKMARDFGIKGQTPFTPALSIMYALCESLKLIESYGMSNRINHHKSISASVRRAITAMGLSLFARGSGSSSTVTAVYNPPGVEGKDIRDRMRKDFGVVIAGGQGTLTDKIFRIGHVGFVGEKELLYTLSALEQVLKTCGVAVSGDWRTAFYKS